MHWILLSEAGLDNNCNFMRKVGNFIFLAKGNCTMNSKQLAENEQYQILTLSKAKFKAIQIAESLGNSPSDIGHELKRNIFLPRWLDRNRIEWKTGHGVGEAFAAAEGACTGIGGSTCPSTTFAAIDKMWLAWSPGYGHRPIQSNQSCGTYSGQSSAAG